MAQLFRKLSYSRRNLNKIEENTNKDDGMYEKMSFCSS